MGVTVQTGVSALQNIYTNPNATQIQVNSEDQRPTNVPLGFDFPYFGKVFNQSWMSENGAVTFKNPGNYTFCCNGLPLTSVRNSLFDYTIYPLWTDLTTKGGGKMYTLGQPGSMTYGWYDMREYGTQNRNSFELSLREDGTFKTSMSGAIVSSHSVASGFTGDLSKGERYQAFYKHVDGLQDKSMTWSYGKLPEIEAPKVTEVVTEVKEKRSVFDYSIATIEAIPVLRSIDFAGNDLLRSAMRSNRNEERETENKKSRESKKEENDDNPFLSAAVQNATMSILSFNNPLVLSMYSKPMMDAPFYRDRGVYRNQKVVDNARSERQLKALNEGFYGQIVEQQWELKK
jgi:hypothetical protein